MAAPIGLARFCSKRIFQAKFSIVRRNSHTTNFFKVSSGGRFLKYASSSMMSSDFIQKPLLQSYTTGCSYESHDERKCWKCKRKTLPTEYFFCECGLVQSAARNVDYFSLFGIDIQFDIDTHALSTIYKNLQRRLHPDMYSQKSQEEMRHADEQSSLVNKAYFTLLKPLSRGIYFLELQGDPIEELSNEVDTEFLLEIMEMNERLADANSDDDIADIKGEIGQTIQSILVEISDAFDSKQLKEAKRLMVRYQYFGNIEEKIKDKLRAAM